MESDALATYRDNVVINNCMKRVWRIMKRDGLSFGQATDQWLLRTKHRTRTHGDYIRQLESANALREQGEKK